MHRRAVIVMIAIAQFALALVAGAGWAWSAAWHTNAVGAMGEQLVIDGVIDAGAAAAIANKYGSLSAYLQQGWDGRSLLFGGALLLIAAGGPIAVLIAVCVGRPALGIAKEDRVL